MAYETRLLPRDDWPTRLLGTSLETLWPQLLQTESAIVVVERDGAIVACWALLKVWHVEGLWVAPSQRGNPVVAKRLLIGMRRAARAVGVTQVFTAAVSRNVRRLLATVKAQRLPGAHYVMPVGRPN